MLPCSPPPPYTDTSSTSRIVTILTIALLLLATRHVWTSITIVIGNMTRGAKLIIALNWLYKTYLSSIQTMEETHSPSQVR